MACLRLRRECASLLSDRERAIRSSYFDLPLPGGSTPLTGEGEEEGAPAPSSRDRGRHKPISIQDFELELSFFYHRSSYRCRRIRRTLSSALGLQSPVFEGAPRLILSEELETLKRQRPEEWYGFVFGG